MGIDEDLIELSEYFNEEQLTEFVIRLIEAENQFMIAIQDIPPK